MTQMQDYFKTQDRVDDLLDKGDRREALVLAGFAAAVTAFDALIIACEANPHRLSVDVIRKYRDNLFNKSPMAQIERRER